jgi:uncharacterized integral membrane protein
MGGDVMLSFIFFVLILFGIGLAVFGALVLGSVLFGESERARLAREAREAERRSRRSPGRRRKRS